ncbi:MAG: hypothetical protein EXS58_13720 [Candidatus Latescibacteria bacterium]|nr:hypothetical protein [Candidatus Latescibacterota bacterium]
MFRALSGLLASLLVAAALGAAPLQVLSAGEQGLRLVLTLSPPRVPEVELEGRRFQQVELPPGYARLAEPGQPALPFFAAPIAVPPGAQVQVEVEEARWHRLSGLELAPAPRYEGTNEDPRYETDPRYYLHDTFAPAQRFSITEGGHLRGVRTCMLQLYPFRYNPVRRELEYCAELRVRVKFVGGRRPKAGRAADTPAAAPLYRALLNPAQAPRWREEAGAAKLGVDSEWYDPGRPWVKVYADEDALFRVDPAWLDSLGVALGTIDPRTFQVFYLGQEQAIRVHGEQDGSFDAPDYLLFFGQYRRDAYKDFENLYGRRNTYWLTWGGAPGKRLQEHSGAPVHGYPVSPWKWTTAHFEQDIRYNPLPLTPPEQELEVDHWFWEEPVAVVKPSDVPSSRIYAQPLLHRAEGEEYTAHLRVVMHGVSDNIHHTGVLFNEQRIDQRVWRGPDELRLESEIPSAYLKDQNRLRLQLFADQSLPDQVFFNWFEIDYRRAYQTWIGYFDFTQPPGGQSYVLQGLYPPGIEVWDVAHEYYFTDFQTDSTAARGAFITFEDNPVDSARYVAADTLAGIKRPRGKVDLSSSWRTPNHQADYLIITHADFLEAAQRLAAHRREGGLSVEVVDVEDLYDEFSYGQMTSEVVRDFITYAYRSWEHPPVYVLLAGNTHYAYRSSRPSFVPTLYYHARNRGEAGSDYLYSLLDGDLLPELAVGRLSFTNPEESLEIVDKIIRYDQAPEPGDWRSRVIYLATFHEIGEFVQTNAQLATQYTKALGLNAVAINNPDNTPIPNLSGKRFLDELNQGALLVNFSGHGSIGTMQFFFSTQFPDWDYLSQVRNDGRLPLMVALSCLNGQFAEPFNLSLSESMTLRKEGGGIAYISASAQGRPAQQALLGDRLFAQFFQEGGTLEFGPALDIAKVKTLAAHPSFEDVALTMQLQGDPAQRLALPRQPDYEALDLRLDKGEVFSQDTLKVEALLRNNTRLGSDSVQVALLVYRPQAEAPPETLIYQKEAPFAGTLTLAANWSVGAGPGPYAFELQVDPAGAVPETDEGNNQLQRQVEVHSPVIPGLLFPLSGAVLPAEGLVLEALLPLSGGPFDCEFALSADPAFADPGAGYSALATPVQGKAGYHPQGLKEGQGYFWRARVHSGAGLGPWSVMRSFWVEAGQTLPRWQQQGLQFLSGEELDLELSGTGMVLSAATRALQPGADTREAGVAVQGLEGAGVVCADGTYLYAKRWFNDKSTVYPGTDFFTRIGSGFNGTQFGQVYGVLADSTTAGISATCHSDGYIYSEMGDPFSLERLSMATGKKDTVTVPEGLLEWKNGQIESGHALITSDGRYIYNVSMSSEAGTRNQWRVRVFDPARNWALLRDFTSSPTETGFTFTWTDGILADGERLYFIEYRDGRRIRMVDSRDGRLLGEWQSDQDSTGIISGQYDWVNNKVWLGELEGPRIFRYEGLGRVTRGQLLSPAIGPAAAWQGLSVQGQGVEVEVEGRQGAGAAWQSLQDVPPTQAGQSTDLRGVDAAKYPQLRLRARLQGNAAHLDKWSSDFAPQSSLGLAQARLDSAGRVEVVVRNLGVVETGARLRLEQGERRTRVWELTLTPLQRGEARLVRFDSLAAPPAGRLFVRLLLAQADADPQDDMLEVSLQEGGRVALGFSTWPGGRPLLDGDPLVSGEGLLVQVDGEGHLALAVDGAPVQPDSVWEGPGVLYRPSLKPGEHRLQAHVLRGGREVGFAELRFRLSEELVIANALPYPQPVREGTSFTYVLSHAAQVAIEIYTLSGRRVLRLGPLPQEAGFQQMAWDGCDQEGSRLANGAYLYRISAEGPQGHGEFRGPLSVVR